MALNLTPPDISELKPRITVFGVGGAGGNAVNNMITAGLQGVDFVVANTDAQALTMSKAQRIMQMGTQVTQGLGAGSQPDVGAAAAQEVIDEIRDHLSGANMVFVTAGMGGGTGTGAAPVIAKTARDMGILTVGVVTKPFHFEGQRRMRTAESGIAELHKVVDTLLIIPNQNLFRVANEKTTFADAFAMADQVLYSGVACITDLMVKEGLINLDFADVRAVMREMGKAMMGTGEASGDKRALTAAEAAIANPLIDDSSMKGARGLLISITGGKDLTLFEVDEAATRIREEVDQDANIIVGATFDESLDGIIRVSVVATGIEQALISQRDAGRDPYAEPGDSHRPAGKSPGRTDRPAARRQCAPRRARRPEDGGAGSGAYGARGSRCRAAAASFQYRRTRRACRHCGGGRGAAAGGARAAAARLLWRRHGSPDRRAEADPVPRPPRGAGRGPGSRATPETFIPQAAERAPARAPRMPKFEELPMPAQNEIRQARGDAEDEHPQKTRMSLLQRLANVGLGRRDEESEPPIAARASGPAMAPMPPLRTGSRSARPATRTRQTIRYLSMLAGPRRKVWTSMAVPRLLPLRHRATIIWISRPFCAARPTEDCYNRNDQKVPARASRDLNFLSGRH